MSENLNEILKDELLPEAPVADQSESSGLESAQQDMPSVSQDMPSDLQDTNEDEFSEDTTEDSDIHKSASEKNDINQELIKQMKHVATEALAKFDTLSDNEKLDSAIYLLEGLLAEDTNIALIENMINLISDSILDYVGSDEALVNKISTMLTYGLACGMLNRYDTDKHIDTLRKFGYNELQPILETCLSTDKDGFFDGTKVDDYLKTRMLSFLLKSESAKDYYNSKKYLADAKLLLLLSTDAGSRHITGVKPGRNILLLSKLIGQSYKSAIEQRVTNVLAVYKRCFQGGFDLEPLDAVFTLLDGTPAFYVDQNTSSAYSHGFTKKIDDKMATVPHKNYMAANKYLIDTFSTNVVSDTNTGDQSLYPIKATNARQFSAARMLGYEGLRECKTSEDFTLAPVITYFPYKIAEYAYGMRSTVNMNKAIYANYAGDDGWEAFAQKHVRENITQYFIDAIMIVLERSGALSNDSFDDRKGPVAGVIDRALDRVSTCMCTMFLAVEVQDRANWSAYTLRLCAPSRNLPTAQTLIGSLEEVIRGTVPPEINKEIVEDAAGERNIVLPIYTYQYIYDKAAYYIEPKFAYTALESLLKQGKRINLNNIILGISDNGDSIMKSAKGSPINLSSKIVHWVIAGSRSGKGVMTMNLLAAHVAGGRAIFYLDRKPDIGVMLANKVPLTNNGMPKGFIINGGQSLATYDTIGRPGLLNYASDDFEGRKEHLLKNVPDHIGNIQLIDSAGQPTQELADFVYLRAMLFCLGLLAIRANNIAKPSVLAKVGGKEGFTMVFDEYSNFSRLFIQTFLHPRSLFNTAYIIPTKRLKLIEDLAVKAEAVYSKMEAGTDVSKQDLKLVDEFTTNIEELRNMAENAYATDLAENMRINLDAIGTLRRAGLDNDATKTSTDLFIIGQDYPGEYGEAKGIFFAPSASNDSNWNSRLVGGHGDSETPDYLISTIASLQNFQDFFLGYNRDLPALAHFSDPSGKANTRLTATRRNFAYVDAPSIEFALSRDKSTTQDFDNKTTYFKPFLILGEGIEPGNGTIDFEHTTDEEVTAASLDEPRSVFMYELITAIKNNSAAGYATWHNLRQKHVVENNIVNREIGFGAYIDRMAEKQGIDPTASLTKAYDIANTVIHEGLGYPEDLDIYDFLFDFRPEWNFNIKLLADCFKEGTVKYTEDVKHKEHHVRTQKLLEQYDNWQVRLEAAKQAREEGDNELEGALEQAVNLGVKSVFDDTLPVAETEVIDPSELSYISAMEELASQEYQPATLSRSGISGEALATTASIIADGTQIQTNPANAPYSTMPLPNNQVAQLGLLDETDIEPVELPKEVTSLLSEDTVDIQAVTESVTKDVIRKFGGIKQIQSLSVQNGKLIINGAVYNNNLPADMLNKLPFTLKTKATAKLYGYFFNYAYLTKMENLKMLSVDSGGFMLDVIAPAFGFTSTDNLRVSGIFGRTHINTLVLAGTVHQRAEVMQKRGNSIFTNAEKRQKVRAVVSTWATAKRKSGWGLFRSSWNDMQQNGFKLRHLFALPLIGTTMLAWSGLHYLGLGLKEVGTLAKDTYNDYSDKQFKSQE